MVDTVLTPATGINTRGIREWTPPGERLRAIMEDLLRLDTILNPGLPASRFNKLFAICRGCRLVMTRRVVLIHECIPGDVTEKDEEEEIIDLTGIDEE